MALSAKLYLRQTQALVITPQLMQAIRLLQMSGQELDAFIDAEIEQNPLLDRDTADASEPVVSEGSTADEPGDAVDVIDLEIAPTPIDRMGGASGSGSGNVVSPDAPGPELRIAAVESLSESLERQVDRTFADPVERAIAAALLAALDPTGYLTTDLRELAAGLGASLGMVESVLLRCQQFEPTGVFARTLAECLGLQLAERNRLDPAMQALLGRLDLVASRNFAAAAVHCGVDLEDMHDMVKELRALDPKPCVSHSNEPLRPLVPDVYVRAAPGGGWRVELNEAMLPRLIVDRSYATTVIRSGDDRRFVSDCLQKASWLEKSLDQRARTILKVAAEIVRQQEAFLERGVTSLRPLNLRIVADAIGMHESTVSRATANKYMATPRGIVEFKYFFSSAIHAVAGGDAHSAESVKHRIRGLILGERPDAVLSDDAIVERLGRDGIDIARRTVAKYREAMRIGSSVERRRDARMSQPRASAPIAMASTA